MASSSLGLKIKKNGRRFWVSELFKLWIRNSHSEMQLTLQSTWCTSTTHSSVWSWCSPSWSSRWTSSSTPRRRWPTRLTRMAKRPLPRPAARRCSGPSSTPRPPWSSSRSWFSWESSCHSRDRRRPWTASTRRSSTSGTRWRPTRART